MMPIGMPMTIASSVETVTIASVIIVSSHKPTNPMNNMPITVITTMRRLRLVRYTIATMTARNMNQGVVTNNASSQLRKSLQRMRHGIDDVAIGTDETLEAVVDTFAPDAHDGVVNLRKRAEQFRQVIA